MGEYEKKRTKGVQNSSIGISVNTIRLSASAIRKPADSLILSVDSLIVFAGRRKEGGNGVEVYFSCSLIVCRHVVTLLR